MLMLTPLIFLVIISLVMVLIISQLGSPAVSPKPRGYSSGRKSGEIQSPRPRLPVIKKRKSPASIPKIPA